MLTVGSYEAKTHLPRLLKRVEKGETVVITNRGVPVAQIVPIESSRDEDLRSLVDRMLTARAKRPKVTHAEILAARDEGRRG